MNLFTLIILVLQQEFLTAVLSLHVSLGSFTLNLTKTFLGWILEILFYDTFRHAGFLPAMLKMQRLLTEFFPASCVQAFVRKAVLINHIRGKHFP